MSAPSFTCPVCGRTSWHPRDVEERYCGACHGLTEEPPPPGFRWFVFVGPGEGNTRFGRLMLDDVEEGATYEMVGTGEAYRYDGEQFVVA